MSDLTCFAMKSRFDKLEMTTEINSLLTTATPSAVDGDGGNAPPPPLEGWLFNVFYSASTQSSSSNSNLFWIIIRVFSCRPHIYTSYKLSYYTLYKSQYQPVIVNLKILLDKSDYGEGITEILNSHWSVISLPPTNIVLEKPSHQFPWTCLWLNFRPKHFLKLSLNKVEIF